MYAVYGMDSSATHIVQVVGELLLLGFYILLFGSYLYMMGSRRPSETVDTSLYMALTITLFVLSTIFVMEYTVNLVHFSTRAFTAVMTGDFGPVVRPSAEKTII
jgi:membrane-associated HD superfamily phosphohydrolase